MRSEVYDDGISVVWADIAGDDTHSYSSMYNIQNKSTRHLQVMSLLNATGTEINISLCRLGGDALRLFGFQAPLWSLNLTMLDNPRMFLNFMQRNSFLRIKDQKLIKN